MSRLNLTILVVALVVGFSITARAGDHADALEADRHTTRIASCLGTALSFDKAPKDTPRLAKAAWGRAVDLCFELESVDALGFWRSRVEEAFTKAINEEDI